MVEKIITEYLHTSYHNLSCYNAVSVLYLKAGFLGLFLTFCKEISYGIQRSVSIVLRTIIVWPQNDKCSLWETTYIKVCCRNVLLNFVVCSRKQCVFIRSKFVIGAGEKPPIL